MLGGGLNGRQVWRRIHVCIPMAESLCCSEILSQRFIYLFIFKYLFLFIGCIGLWNTGSPLAPSEHAGLVTMRHVGS